MPSIGRPVPKRGTPRLTVSEAKLKKIQSYGAKTQLVGNDSGDAEVAARNYAEKNQLPYLSPYNDEDVIASSSAFLRTILQLGGKDALLWLSPNPEETLNAYIQIIHYLLRQDISDRASRYVGGIIMSLVQATSLERLVSTWLASMIHCF